jgi:energy-coupling factor transport system ATP-binding protein
MKTAVEVKNLYYSYPSEAKNTLADISFSVNENEVFAIIGPSGCGKTTLALVLNGIIPKSLKGKLEGNILVDGKNIRETTTPELAQKVQILFQLPDSQLFALNVADEISFGPENLNMPWNEIEKRVNEALEKLKIEELRNSSIEELSSGQKQKTALASVLAMKPKILILDEPTANLDPESVENFSEIIEQLKKEMTIILIEHNINFVKRLSDRMMLMNEGKVICIKKTEQMLKDRQFIELMTAEPEEKIKYRGNGKKILEIKNAVFSYPNKVMALKDVSLDVHKGDFLGIVGMNGSGKSTLALNIIGLLKGEGKIILNGKDISKQDTCKRAKHIGYVFQNPNYQLFEDNVEKEIEFGLKNIFIPENEISERTKEALNTINMLEFAKEDPYSLSVGQKKRVTIASVLAMLPEIIIIDEPDTGLDCKTAIRLIDYVRKLNEKGHTIIMISHNTELVKEYCNRVICMENGKIK